MFDLNLIKDVKVSWMEGYSNSPRLQLEFHGAPWYEADWYKQMHSEHRYQRHDFVTGEKCRIKQLNSFEHAPNLDTFTWVEVDDIQTLWWSEHPLGFVSFYAHSGGEQNEGGFGGSNFNITLTDGTTKLLRGPWSSRPGYGNARKIGSEPWLECGSFTVKLSLYLAIVERFLPDLYLFEYNWKPGQEWGLYVSAFADKCAKPSGQEFAKVSDKTDNYWAARPWKRS